MSDYSENSNMKDDTRMRPLLSPDIGASHRPMLSPHLGASHGEVLWDGYEYVGENIKISVSKTTASGITFSSTSARDQDRSVHGLRAFCNYNDASIDFKLDKSSSHMYSDDLISGNLCLTKELLPSTTAKAVFALPYHIGFPYCISSKFSMLFRHRHATLWMANAVGPVPGIAVSLTTGTPSIRFGLAMDIQRIIPISTWVRRNWTGVIQVTRPTWDAQMLLHSYQFSASYVHYLDKEKKFCVGAKIDRCFITHESNFMAGGAWIIDHLTTVKARIDHHGRLETLLHRKIEEKACLKICANFDIKEFNRKPGIGLAVALEL